MVKINFHGGKNQFLRWYKSSSRGACSSAGNPQLPEASIDWAICDGRVALE